MPYPENILQPPDMQAAVGPAAPPPDPLAAVQGLIEAMSQANQAPLLSTPMHRFAAGLMGAPAAAKGLPNPAITQALDQRKQEMDMLEAQMRNRLTLETLRSKVQEQKVKHEESALGIYKSLVTQDDPRLKTMGVQGMLGLLEQRGVPMPPGLKDGLLLNRIDPKDLPRLGELLDMGAPLSVVQRSFPAFTQVDHQEYMALKGQPAFRKMAGLKSIEEVDKDQAERDLKILDLLFTKYGIAGNSPQANAIKQMSFHLYSTTFDKLTEAQRKHTIDQFDIKTGDLPKLSDESSLRGQFLQGAKTWQEVRDAYMRISASATNPSPAGDIALITGYMKLIDPTTGVKEGEFATARNASSIPEQIRALYNRLVSGTGLITPNQRMDFIQQAYALFDQHRLRQTELETEFQGIAIRKGMVPRDIVPDLLGALRGSTAPVRRLRVRSKKDKTREGWKELQPGESLPSDVEAME